MATPPAPKSRLKTTASMRLQWPSLSSMMIGVSLWTANLFSTPKCIQRSIWPEANIAYWPLLCGLRTAAHASVCARVHARTHAKLLCSHLRRVPELSFVAMWLDSRLILAAHSHSVKNYDTFAVLNAGEPPNHVCVDFWYVLTPFEKLQIAQTYNQYWYWTATIPDDHSQMLAPASSAAGWWNLTYDDCQPGDPGCFQWAQVREPCHVPWDAIVASQLPSSKLQVAVQHGQCRVQGMQHAAWHCLAALDAPRQCSVAASIINIRNAA